MKEFNQDLLNSIKNEANPLEDSYQILQEWQKSFSDNFRKNLTEIIKKDKVLPHFMRVLSVPFTNIFQSELYCYSLPKDQNVEVNYNEQDLILLQLILLKTQYKAKTPSNTIRKLKYETMTVFKPALLLQIYEELSKQAEADPEQKPIF